jgi:hypothetical protein
MGHALEVDFLCSGILGTNNKPLAYGKVYTYTAGTTTLNALYSASDKSGRTANPIILDNRGAATAYADGSYKFIVKDKNDVTIATYDNMNYVIPSTEVTSVTPVSSSPYSATSNPEFIKVNTAADNIIVNLPSAIPNPGLRFIVEKASADANTVTVTPYGSETINKAATKVLTLSDEILEIISDGANWTIVNTPVGGTITETSTDVLTNKTLTSPVINGTVTGVYTLGGTTTILVENSINLGTASGGWIETGTCSYYKDPMGLVHITGFVSDSGAASSEVYNAANGLGAGYRPSENLYFLAGYTRVAGFPIYAIITPAGSILALKGDGDAPGVSSSIHLSSIPPFKAA